MNIRFRSKEENEFIQIFRSHKHNIYGFVCRTLNNHHAAEDITEESFLRLYERLINGYKIEKPYAWLLVTARNLCLNLIRDTRNEVPMETLDSLPTQVKHTNPDIKRQLNEAIARLDIRQREAFILKEIEGFSYSEIADILGTTMAGVRSLLYRARVELKNMIANGNIRR
jgi:RNA polymerase sigma-70 factor (ECF subfamily)